MSATLRQGTPVNMSDYTPSGADVSAGEVVVIGDVPFVAHNDITDGELGALATGGGEYSMTAGAAIAVGEVVYFNDTANKVNNSAGATIGDKMFGFMAPSSAAAAADGDTVYIQHAPNGTAKA